ncbi:MAG TPA: hypothetical protein VFB58_03655 [Chloroflexota bacterium]|nr:hypothetical protein [Chloroflexota bacterium]
MKQAVPRCLPVFFLVAVALAVPQAIASPASLTAVRVAYGIRFTMAVPRRSYPADALAPVTVVTSPAVEAVFTPPAGATGPLYYSEVFICRDADGTVFGGGMRGWLHVTGSVVPMLPAPMYCPTVLQWEITGGWVNYPLGTARYIVPSQTASG